MKNLFLTALIIAGGAVFSEEAMADCPELAGAYSCINSVSSEVQVHVEQEETASGIVKYTFDHDGQISAFETGGKKVPFDDNGFVGTRSARCEGGKLLETVEADISEGSKKVGEISWVTESVLKPNGYESISQGTMNIEGDINALYFEQSCVRK